MGTESPSRLVFSGPVLRVGEFRCPPEHAAWRVENYADEHLIVFPRVGVWITQAGREPVVADPNTVMFYNAGCTYRRRAISQRGDECEWFAVPGRLIAEAAADFDPRVRDRPDEPFAFDHAQTDAATYLLQRRIYQQVRAQQGGRVDRLAFEEMFMTVLRESLARAYRARGCRERPVSEGTRASHRRAAEAVKALLAHRFAEGLGLSEIADAVALSPFHLCRVFRRQTGVPIHRYRNRLRVRSALERMGDEPADLTRLALSLGFSSHAHFTGAFKKEFGVPPVRARRDLREGPGISGSG